MLVFVGFYSSKFGLEWVAVDWVGLYVSNLCLRVRSNFIGKSRAKAEKQAGTSPPQDLNSSTANQHSKSKPDPLTRFADAHEAIHASPKPACFFAVLISGLGPLSPTWRCPAAFEYALHPQPSPHHPGRRTGAGSQRGQKPRRELPQLRLFPE